MEIVRKIYYGKWMATVKYNKKQSMLCKQRKTKLWIFLFLFVFGLLWLLFSSFAALFQIKWKYIHTWIREQIIWKIFMLCTIIGSNCENRRPTRFLIIVSFQLFFFLWTLNKLKTRETFFFLFRFFNEVY